MPNGFSDFFQQQNAGKDVCMCAHMNAVYISACIHATPSTDDNHKIHTDTSTLTVSSSGKGHF